MDIFFRDPGEIPLPPNEVRIRELRAKPWPDGRRVRVYLEVDPFQKRPSADIEILNPTGQEVASANIIESMDRKIEITMHLRGETPPGDYQIAATLFYLDEIEQNEGAEYQPRQAIVIDRRLASFHLE